VLLTTSGCASVHPAGQRPAAATRPATKVTCADVRWTPPPELPVEQSSRELVGFSPTLLGVHTTWTGRGITVDTMAGGYVDDLTEPYDDLAITGETSVAGGIEADVMHGTLRGLPVVAVLWRDPSQHVPCDVHALLAVGADPVDEARVLAGLR
jgi:hypothetical protein